MAGQSTRFRGLNALLVLVSSAIVIFPALLHADEAPGIGSSTTQPSASASAPSTSGAGGALDFDLLDDKPKLDPAAEAAAAAKAEQIQHKVQVRRRVLLAHQAIGFTTLALMTATVILGQVNYVARYNGFHDGLDYDRYQTAHFGLSMTTTAFFTTLGVLGLAAPNPYPKPIKMDSALVHKVSMALSTAGMVTQIILGLTAAAFEGRIEQRNIALGHVINGYATLGFMTAGVLAYVF